MVDRSVLNRSRADLAHDPVRCAIQRSLTMRDGRTEPDRTVVEQAMPRTREATQSITLCSPQRWMQCLHCRWGFYGPPRLLTGSNYHVMLLSVRSCMMQRSYLHKSFRCIIQRSSIVHRLYKDKEKLLKRVFL